MGRRIEVDQADTHGPEDHQSPCSSIVGISLRPLATIIVPSLPQWTICNWHDLALFETPPAAADATDDDANANALLKVGGWYTMMALSLMSCVF